jgi:hypothetical protein
MDDDQLRSPQHIPVRKTLRIAGLVLLATGGLLTLIGMGSFFASFGSFGPPRFFWCAFLGMPLLFVGAVLTMFGFAGAVQRYLAGESAPVAKDVVNYMGEKTQPGVKALAKAVTEGIREGLAEEPEQKT